MSRTGIREILKIGIRAKFIILVNILLFLSVAILSWIFIYHAVDSLQDEFRTRIIEKRGEFLWIGLGFGGLIMLFGSMICYIVFDRESKIDNELRKNIRDLAVLNATALHASQSLDLKTILCGVLEEVLGVTGMDASWVYILDEKDNLLRIAAYSGISSDFVEKIDRLTIGEGIAGRVGSSGEPIVIEDISKDERLTREVVRETGFMGFISVPVRSREKILGAINIASRKRHELITGEVNLLQGIGNQIGMAITNSKLYGELKTKIDELRLTQDQLIHSARLAAVGELSGHIAHEINNPLTGVLGYTSLLIETETDSERKKQLNIIEAEGLRAREIVKKLLDFAHQAEPKRERVNINRIIKVVLSLIIGPAKASNIEMAGEYSDELPDILIDVNQIEQVFLNIINNSMDAMPKGGILTVRTYLDGRYVAVSISDNGRGIHAEALPRIFEPFFTTKEKVSGTGLGLSVSLGIIKRHGGKIDVESVVGEGSKFIVRLPIQEIVA